LTFWSRGLRALKARFSGWEDTARGLQTQKRRVLAGVNGPHALVVSRRDDMS